MELIILTGMSGAGKSSALEYLEDMGYYCIDNLPPQLLEVMLQSMEGKEFRDVLEKQRLVLVMDARSAERFGRLSPSLQALIRKNPGTRVVFLEAAEKVILSRYKQSRRNHPMGGSKMLLEAIREERDALIPVRELATDIIDTSQTTPAELRDMMYRLFREPEQRFRMKLFLQSFGFKYGLPLDCDMVLDVRFIPNPYYIPELRPLSGLDREVSQYVMSFPETMTFLDRQMDFFRFALPFYQREGKMRMNIGIGCTGGRHRSVALTAALAEQLQPIGYPIYADHRDIKRDPSGEV